MRALKVAVASAATAVVLAGAAAGASTLMRTHTAPASDSGTSGTDTSGGSAATTSQPSQPPTYGFVGNPSNVQLHAAIAILNECLTSGDRPTCALVTYDRTVPNGGYDVALAAMDAPSVFVSPSMWTPPAASWSSTMECPVYPGGRDGDVCLGQTP